MARGGKMSAPERDVQRVLGEIGDMIEADRRYDEPPCMECGASTPEEAEKLCNCGGDKDDCHGCHLWPD